jgi:hypothetical protein
VFVVAPIMRRKKFDMQNWNTSFQALVLAYDSIKRPTKLLNTTSSSLSLQTQESIPTKRKRKRSDSPITSPKSLKTGINNYLSWRFATSVSIEPKKMKIPDKLTNHLNKLSHQMGLKIDETKETWQMKLNELESNLSMIVNTIPNDSFDDIKLIVSNIISNAEFLAGDNMNDIENIVPSWKYAETSLHNLIRFIQIVQDMQQPIVLNEQELQKDIETRLELVQSKRSLFGDLLRQECVAWLMLGYPVQELKPVIAKFQKSLFQMNWSVITRIEEAIRGSVHEIGLGYWEKPIVMILETIHLITETVLLIGTCKVTEELQSHATSLSLLLIEKISQIFTHLLKSHRNSKLPDAKVCFLYETLIQLFEYCILFQLLLDSPLDVTSTTTSCSSIVQEPMKQCDVTVLFHPAIEAGLELITYAGSKNDDGFQDVILHLCAKYLFALCELMEPVLDPAIVSQVSLQ